MTATAASLDIALPWPPSNNVYYRHVGPKVLISAEGRAYRDAVRSLALMHRWLRVPGKVAVHAVAHPPDRRKRDLDNLWKSVLDAATHAGLIDDDSHIDDLRITRGAVTVGGSLLVSIKPYEEITK